MLPEHVSAISHLQRDLDSHVRPTHAEYGIRGAGVLDCPGAGFAAVVGRVGPVSEAGAHGLAQSGPTVSYCYHKVSLGWSQSPIP